MAPTVTFARRLLIAIMALTVSLAIMALRRQRMRRRSSA